jgi:hypothetical protein
MKGVAAWLLAPSGYTRFNSNQEHVLRTLCFRVRLPQVPPPRGHAVHVFAAVVPPEATLDQSGLGVKVRLQVHRCLRICHPERTLLQR